MEIKCDRCSEIHCICGDPAFEVWLEELEELEEEASQVVDDGSCDPLCGERMDDADLGRN